MLLLSLKKWLTASIIWVGEVWKLFFGIQNKLQNPLLFITNDLNTRKLLEIRLKNKYCGLFVYCF